MDFCYREQVLPQVVYPCTYYLPYLPTFPVQNYIDSTFAYFPVAEQQPFPNITQTIPYTVLSSVPTINTTRVSSQESKHRNFDGPKESVIQKLEYKNKEQQSKKAVQKQSRNVLSNLLRILFKNIIQVRMYDSLIAKIIQSNNFNTSTDQFYLWLEIFGINFKNYIRFASVKKIMGSRKRKDHLTIFRALIEEYAKISAITHCLTSKRIDKQSVRMHLQGLRQLRKDLLHP